MTSARRLFYGLTTLPLLLGVAWAQSPKQVNYKNTFVTQRVELSAKQMDWVTAGVAVLTLGPTIDIPDIPTNLGIDIISPTIPTHLGPDLVIPTIPDHLGPHIVIPTIPVGPGITIPTIPDNLGPLIEIPTIPTHLGP